MALTEESTSFPSRHFPCYNNPGELVIESTDPGALVQGGTTPRDILYIGAKSDGEINLSQLDSDAFVVVVDDPSGFNVWPGDYVKIENTSFYDGSYLILDRISSVLVLDGIPTVPEYDPYENGATAVFDPKVELTTVLTIEDEHNIGLRIPASSDGLFRLATADFIKDYFKFRFRSANLGGGFFQQYVGQIRFSVIFIERFVKYNPVVTNGITTYEREVITGTPLQTNNFYCFNAAMNYYDASNSNADAGAGETDYYQKYLLTTVSSASFNRFCTYRPQNTHIQRDEPAFVSIIRSDFATDDYRIYFKAYDSAGTEVWSASQQWGNTPTAYEDAHCITWNVGQVNQYIISPMPSSAVYYEVYPAIGTDQIAQEIRFNLVEKCGERYTLIWKNEFGFPDAYTFYAPAEEFTNNDFEQAGIGDYVGNHYQPGNTAKVRVESPRSITLNTGLIDSAHAKWLLGIGRSTEVFLIDWQNRDDFPGANLFDSAIPVTVRSQQVGTVNSKRNIHNYSIECVHSYNRSQIGNRMVV